VLAKGYSVTSDFSKRTTYIDGQLTSTDNLHRRTTYIDGQLTSADNLHRPTTYIFCPNGYHVN